MGRTDVGNLHTQATLRNRMNPFICFGLAITPSNNKFITHNISSPTDNFLFYYILILNLIFFPSNHAFYSQC